MSGASLRLFELLPALYRLRDARLADSPALLSPAETVELETLKSLARSLSTDEQARFDALASKAARGPLASLLMLIEEQLSVVAQDLDQLYDDQFIETCAPWVIPYIGDLIGYQAVNGIAPTAASPRAEVANTISFRRRKGTALVMEQLARDVTGWSAHAVEFFLVLGDTQYMNHPRPHAHYAPDVRHWKTGLYIGTGFDRTCHTVDVRRISIHRGRYNIPNIGIFLWSLNAYSVTKASAFAVAAQAGGYRFSSLGRDIPLFNRPVSQGSEITSPACPVNVPSRLARRVLCEDLRSGAGASYYGEGNSLAVYVNGKLLEPYEIQVCNLSGHDGSWFNVLGSGSPYAAAVDPVLGRIALPPSASAAPEVLVSYHYGFNADLGGGEYPREGTFAVEAAEWVLPFPDTATVPRYNNLQAALDYAVSQLTQTGQVAVEVTSSETIDVTAPVQLTLPAGTSVELRAADGCVPTLSLGGEIHVSGAESSVFAINGLRVESRAVPTGSTSALIHIPANAPDGGANLLSRVSIAHCTFVPGWSLLPDGESQYPGQPSIIAAAAGLQIEVSQSIIGTMLIDEPVAVSVSDSIVDGNARTRPAYSAADGVSAGGALTLTGCTVVGKVHSTLLTLVSDSIIWAGLAEADKWKAPLWTDRKQSGCVRFSYLPPGSLTPRRFECVEQVRGVPQPLFFSLRYGDPAYAKLVSSTDDVIRRGAEDGGEMGVFHFVLAPLRETDLRVRMQEYLPVGLEFGIIYQS